jgi:hypothetical protein
MKHTDGKPLDYVDAQGVQWVMAACGHRCGGGVHVGQKIALCPNCRLHVMLYGSVPVVYEDRLPRLPENMTSEPRGAHDMPPHEQED